MTLHNIPDNKVFNNWKKEFSKENKILSIKNLFKISRNNKYITRGIDVQFKYNKKKITRYILLLGKSVQIIPLIFCTTDKKYYSILVEQIRIGAQKKILEFPSGAVDTKDKSLKEACIREIDEELNIKVKKNQLFQLSKYPVIMQPVNSYLKCFFFTFKIKLNDVYGVFAINSWRYSDGNLFISKAITLTGQRLVVESAKFVNEEINKELGLI